MQLNHCITSGLLLCEPVYLLFKPVRAPDHVCLMFTLLSLPSHGDNPPEHTVKVEKSRARKDRRETDCW